MPEMFLILLSTKQWRCTDILYWHLHSKKHILQLPSSITHISALPAGILIIS